MTWKELTDLSQLKTIIDISQEQPDSNQAVLVFKHSTRCSISAMALSRLESKWADTASIPTYYLDLLAYRNISNEIATIFQIEHASPQVLLIKTGKCFYHNSHNGISVPDILEAIAKQNQ